MIQRIGSLIIGINVLFLTAILTGCGFTQAKQDAEKVLARHFQAIATNDYESAMDDYSGAFFARTPHNEWSKALENLNGKLGSYQNHSVNGYRVFKRTGALGVGTTVALRCQVSYAKYQATETFTLFKSKASSDYKIVGHQINSDGLLKE